MNLNSKIKASTYGSAVIALAMLAHVAAAEPQEPALEPLAISLEQIQWGPSGGGNAYPVGVRSARQGVDPVSGGITYYALFPSGSHFDLHWHTYDEFVVIVQGSVTIELGEQSHTLGVGSYIVIPGKMNHSWDVPISSGEDAIILVRRAGPADFNFVQ